MNSVMNFETWKQLLQQDCLAEDKFLAFNFLGDYALRHLYNLGLEPTVKALSVKAREQGAPFS